MNIETTITEDQKALLKLFARGLYAKEVARELARKKKTVEKQMEVIKRKLGVKNTTEAVHLATKEGMI